MVNSSEFSFQGPKKTMDAVPYNFCKSVVVTLNEPPDDEELASPVWNAALLIPEHVTREKICLNVFYDNDLDCWGYELKNGNGWHSLTFEELKAINKQHLRISEVRIDIHYDYDDEFEESSMEEIREVMMYTVPFVGLGCLVLSGADDLPPGKKAQILGVLTDVYHNPDFGEIMLPFDAKFIGDSAVMEQFLLYHLQFDCLKSLDISDVYVPEALRQPLIDFISKMSFQEIEVQDTGLRFDMTFFERLIDKPLDGKHCRFNGRFTFDFQQIMETYDHMLRKIYKNSICWKRNDGVWVSVSSFKDSHDILVELQDHAYLSESTSIDGANVRVIILFVVSFIASGIIMVAALISSLNQESCLLCVVV